MGLLLIILLLGILASVSPTTIVVFILLLATTRARINAAAFLIGWSVSLAVVFAFAFAIGGAHAARHGSGRAALEAFEILLGVALLALGGRAWRRRDLARKSSRFTRNLTGHLKQLKPWEAAAVGVLEEPWTLTAAAAVVVARHDSAVLVVVLSFLIFTVVSTATIGGIFVYHGRRPGEAEVRLSELRDRMVRAGPTIFAAVLLLVGVYLVVDGSLALAGF